MISGFTMDRNLKIDVLIQIHNKNINVIQMNYSKTSLSRPPAVLFKGVPH